VRCADESQIPLLTFKLVSQKGRKPLAFRFNIAYFKNGVALFVSMKALPVSGKREQRARLDQLHGYLKQSDGEHCPVPAFSAFISSLI